MDFFGVTRSDRKKKATETWWNSDLFLTTERLTDRRGAHLHRGKLFTMVKRFNHQEFGLISRIATVGTWQLIYEFEYLT